MLFRSPGGLPRADPDPASPAQIWTYVAGGNQEWDLVRIDPDAAQTAKRAEEKPDPQPTPSQRKHQNDLVRKLNNAGQGRASRKD